MKIVKTPVPVPAPPVETVVTLTADEARVVKVALGESDYNRVYERIDPPMSRSAIEVVMDTLYRGL